MILDGGRKIWNGIFSSRTAQPVYQAGPVARSIEEAKLIRTAIADFRGDGPRWAYAEWLSENSDAERAEHVRASLALYESGNSALLQDDADDKTWTRLMGLPLLRLLAEKSADRETFDHLKVLILPWLTPALSLSYAPLEDDPAVGESYLWGLPDLAVGEEWPIIANLSDAFGGLEELPQDHPCAFMAQIAWRDLAKTVFGQDLPETGGLSIFAVTEVHQLGIIETVIRPWFPEGPLSRHIAPQALDDDVYGDGVNSPHSPHRLEFTEVLSLPDPNDGPFKTVLSGCGCNEPYGDIYEALVDVCGENGLGFGGYLRGTSGADPSPGRDWRRLAVLRTNPDVGIIHFAWPAEDISTGSLSNARYVWMDWDS